jgi:hypothetical protein
MKEFIIPLRTDELSIAFCQVTAPLCSDVQRLIWKEVLYCTQPIEAPPAPQKCPKYSRVCSNALCRGLFK